MMVLNVYYIAIKAMFFYSLVHSFVKFENLQKHWLFLALLYTAGVALLSFVWFVLPGQMQIGAWQTWLVKTLVIAVIYFKLLDRFDEGVMFWILLVAGWASSMTSGTETAWANRRPPARDSSDDSLPVSNMRAPFGGIHERSAANAGGHQGRGTIRRGQWRELAAGWCPRRDASDSQVIGSGS